MLLFHRSVVNDAQLRRQRHGTPQSDATACPFRDRGSKSPRPLFCLLRRQVRRAGAGQREIGHERGGARSASPMAFPHGLPPFRPGIDNPERCPMPAGDFIQNGDPRVVRPGAVRPEERARSVPARGGCSQRSARRPRSERAATVARGVGRESHGIRLTRAEGRRRYHTGDRPRCHTQSRTIVFFCPYVEVAWTVEAVGRF